MPSNSVSPVKVTSISVSTRSIRLLVVDGAVIGYLPNAVNETVFLPRTVDGLRRRGIRGGTLEEAVRRQPELSAPVCGASVDRCCSG